MYLSTVEFDLVPIQKNEASLALTAYGYLQLWAPQTSRLEPYGAHYVIPRGKRVEHTEFPTLHQEQVLNEKLIGINGIKEKSP